MVGQLPNPVKQRTYTVNGIYHGYCHHECDCCPVEPFTAWTHCPMCDRYDVHWIAKGNPGRGLVRRCRNLNCQFRWRTA